MVKRSSSFVSISQPGKFYTSNKYRQEFGDPGITKAKIVRRKWKGNTIRGIVVLDEAT